MGLKVINPLIKAVAKKAYVAPKMEVRTLESLGLKMEQLTSDIAKFNTKEIKLNDELFKFLPWRKYGYKEPKVGIPPIYTQEAKNATNRFINNEFIAEPLPNGFRVSSGKTPCFDANGVFKESMLPIQLGGTKISRGEATYYDENSKAIKYMVEQLKKIFSENPNITEEQKARTLHRFVNECYDKSLKSYTGKYSGFIPITNTVASGAGVCRHKSFLAKILGDKLGLNIAMQRGRYIEDIETGIGQAHMWNYVKINNEWFLMDIEGDVFSKLSDYLGFYDSYRTCNNSRFTLSNLLNL